jgi:hypothetical protein
MDSALPLVSTPVEQRGKCSILYQHYLLPTIDEVHGKISIRGQGQRLPDPNYMFQREGRHCFALVSSLSQVPQAIKA